MGYILCQFESGEGLLNTRQGSFKDDRGESNLLYSDCYALPVVQLTTINVPIRIGHHFLIEAFFNSYNE